MLWHIEMAVHFAEVISKSSLKIVAIFQIQMLPNSVPKVLMDNEASQIQDIDPL